ncbi:MAG: DUF92 domain-containing protein, partial [Gemmatimonadetes bacterium]|nr:DUF92 domain-containing protein [Gemmatimonadota bacterium]
VAGFLLAVLIAFVSGLPGLFLVFLFALLGSAASRIPGGTNHESRSAAHAFANLGVPALCACGSLFTQIDAPWRSMIAAALAFGLSDTLATEFGTRYGGAPRSVVTGKRVPAGTNGGVTFTGSLAGIAGALFLALAAQGARLLPDESWPSVAAAGIAGNLVDSILGATIESRGLIGNHAVNFLAALSATGILLLFR